MDTFSHNEQKRLEKLDEMRKVFQSILGSHIGLLLTLFVLVLAAFLTLFYIKAKHSGGRFEAKVTLHYQPVKTKNVQPFNGKYVMHILSRESLRKQFAEDLTDEDGGASGSGAHDVKIEQVGRQDDCFVISLAAATEKDAVEFVNKLAELCISAYTAERRASLATRKEMLEGNRRDFSSTIGQVTQELNELNFTAVMVSPEHNYEHLQTRLSGEKATLAKQKASLQALEQYRRKLEESKAEVYPALLPNISRINEYQQMLGQVAQELQSARERYTAQNPRLKTLENRQRALEKEFHDFLESKGLAVADLEFLESAPAVVRELDKVNEELSSIQAMCEVQERLVASLENEIVEFNEKYPKRQQLVRQQGKLFDAIATLDETLADIEYLAPLVERELFFGEAAHGGHELTPFTKENITLAMLGAVLATSLMAFLIVSAGYRWGKISRETEVESLPNSQYLGILPSAQSKLSEGVSDRLFFSGVSHQFLASDPLPQVVMLGRLPGGEVRKEFISAFAEDCRGEEEQPVMVLELVESKGFKIPADRDLHRGALVLYSGDKGFVPVENTNYLTPHEEARLRQDMLTLRKMCRLVCLVKPTPLTRDGVFLEQVARSCDAAVVAIGMKRTPRRLVRRLQELQDKVRLKVMTVLSGRIKG